MTNQSVVFEGDSLSSSAHSYAKIYDISNRTAPVQLANLGQDGVYQDSAVYNGMLYLISVDAFRLDSENLTLPTVRDNGADVTVPESRIYVCEKPANVAYTLVSSISLADGKRTDVCAFTDGNLYTSISESGIYLARPVSLSAEGESRTETPYTVTDYATSVVTEIKKLSCGDSLTLLNSYNIEGQVQAMDAEGTNLRLVTSILRSDYQIFTDENTAGATGWTASRCRRICSGCSGKICSPFYSRTTCCPIPRSARFISAQTTATLPCRTRKRLCSALT